MIHRDRLIFRLFCIVFWTMCCYGFLSQELLPFLAPGWRPMVLVADAIFAVLGFATLRGKKEIALFTAFWVILILSTKILNGYGWVTVLNGARDFIPVVFGLPIVRYLFQCKDTAEFRRSFDKQLLVFLILQAVCITEQFLRYGAGDHGGGTMGNGSSGIASLSIILIVFYFVTKDWNANEYMASLWRNRWYFFLIYPVFLNETKASFVVIAVMFILLLKPDLKTIGKVVMAAPIIAIVVILMGKAYLAATGQSNDSLSVSTLSEYLMPEDLDFLIESAYAVEEENAVDMDDMFLLGDDIPRFAKFYLIPDIIGDTKGGLALGAGVGQYKGGQTLEYTPFAYENFWFLVGTNTTLLFYAVQLGFIGLLWYILYMIYTIAPRHQAGPMSIQRKILLGFLVVFIAMYNDSFRYYPFTCIFFWIGCITTFPLRDKKSASN